MATFDDVHKIGQEIEKIVNRLIQAEKSVKNTVSSAKTISGGTKSGGVAASFGGLSEETKQVLDKYAAMGAGGGGGGLMAKSLGAVTSVVGATWNSVPGVDDAYKYKQEIFTTAYAASGRFNDNATFGRIKAGFGSGMDATSISAASMMTRAGIGPNSARFSSTMSQAGNLSMFSGRSNASTAAGMVSMQQGTQGVVGTLASYGIFVTDPRTGKGGDLKKLVDQLWARWYGSPTADVDPVQFEADLMGGWVGSDMGVLFGGTPELYDNILTGLRAKAKAHGKSVNWNVHKGKNSAKQALKRAGVKTENTPWQTQQGIEQGRMENIADASDALIKGFQDAAVVINKFNSAVNSFINSGAGQLAFRGKGGFDSLMGSGELGGLGGLLSSFAGNSLANMLFRGGGRGMGRGLLGAGRGLLGGGGRHAAAGVGTRLGATALGKAAGPIGLAIAAAEVGVRGKNAYDENGWSGVGNYASGVTSNLTPLGMLGTTFRGAQAFLGGLFGGEGIMGAIGSGMDAGNPLAASSTSPGGIFGAGSGSSFGAGAGGTLPNNPSQAISWAAQSQSMSGQFDGLCDHYVAKVYGLAHSGYATARAHWQGIPDEYKYPGDKNPPVGALVFWNVGNSGHVAVVTGKGSDGPIVTTTHRGGTPTQMSLAEATKDLGGWGTYYGWSKPYFGGNSTDVGGPASDEAAAAGTDKSKSAGLVATSPTAASQLGVANVMSSGLDVGGIMGSVTTGVSGSPASPGGSANSTSVGGSTLGGSVGGVNVPSSNITGGQKALIGLLARNGFSGAHLKEAWAIAMRESSGRSNAYNGKGPDNSYGLFQINMKGSLGPERDAKFKKYVAGYTGYDSLFDPEVNARAAAYMSHHGENWSSWVSPTFGRAKDYLAQYPGASAGMYLSRDQVVNAHAGEIIVPAEQAGPIRDMLRGGINGLNKPTNITIHVNVKSASREEATQFAKWIKQDLQQESVVDRMRSR